MTASLQQIIKRAEQDRPNPGIVVCDCDTSNVFYIATSQIPEFLQAEVLSPEERTQIEVVQKELSESDDIMILTFQNHELSTITAYADIQHLECVCSIPPS